MRPLSPYRLLDLTHVVAGPFAGMLLADLGMETIKIEPPGRGEITRSLFADHPKYSFKGMGAYFLTFNRNKKSVTIDLKQQAGRDLFYDLVRVSDVVLTNFAPGVTARLGIDYPRLSAVNERIVTCSLTGFGESGPDHMRPAFDMVAQATGGHMSVTGFPDSPPLRSGLPNGDLAAGSMAVSGILAALLSRERTGKGQHVDISMLDTQISLLTYTSTMFFLSGEVPGPLGNAHFLHVPYDTYPCEDGYLVIAVVSDHAWEGLLTAVPVPDLDTPENRRRSGRLANRGVIDRRLAEVLRTDTRSAWLEKLNRARVPAAPVNDYEEALADPQVLFRKMVVDIEHPDGGVYKAPGNPVKLSEMEETFSSPPRLGQHTAEVLMELLGKSEEELALLKARGVIV